MKFIRELLNRKSKSEQEFTAAVEQPDVTPMEDLTTRSVEELPKKAKLRVVAESAAEEVKADPAPFVDDKATDILEKVSTQLPDEDPEEEGSDAQAVNIWDMDGEDDDASADAQQEAPASGRRRRRRNHTRVLGFDDTEDEVVSKFDAATPVAPSSRAKFPVGWVLVTEGEGRGECFSLEAGMSQIGRAEDQAIQLDFGDNSISRVNHAAIVYDTETHSFILGHGGKKNIVRLNGKPVISNETLTTADEIKIGETTLRFVALCTEEFNWADHDNASEEQDDVAIA